MKITPRTILLVVLLAIESLVITGCANTGRGMKADTERNLDKAGLK